MKQIIQKKSKSKAIKICIITVLTIMAAMVFYTLLHGRHTGVYFPGLMGYMILPMRHRVVFAVATLLTAAVLYASIFCYDAAKQFFRDMRLNVKQTFRVKTLFSRKTLLPMIPLILAPFTFFLFGPIEMVVRNAVGLWFTWLDVLLIVLIAFSICFLFFCIIGLVLPGKARHYFIALIWGLGLALYAQGNLMPVDYGILDGRPVAWEEYALWAIANTAIWFALLVVPIITVHFWHDISQKAMLYATCVLLLVQAGTAVYLMAQPSPRRDGQLIVTDENLYTVSENKNIVILILDAFDTEYMNELLHEEPELAELLDGFVFYDNVVGMFPRTRSALPHIMTGIPNLNEMSYWDYLDMAFANAPIYQMLLEHNFSTFIHTFPAFISPLATTYVDNVYEVEWILNDIFGMASSLFRFAGVRYFPHVIKEQIWMYASDFDMHRRSAEHGAGFSTANFTFHNELMQHGLTILPDRNVFSLIHLDGMIGNTIDRNVQVVGSDEGSALDTSRGLLQIVIDYKNHLKNIGVDDNTLFIVIADHGSRQLWQRPLLLVRDPEHRSQFHVNSAPISFVNLMPLLENSVRGELSAVDYLNSISHSQDIRTFFYYDPTNVLSSTQHGALYLPNIHEYLFVDSSADLANARFTGIIHRSAVHNYFEPPVYHLGDTIHLSPDDNPYRFFLDGISRRGIDGTSSWILGNEASFLVQLGEPVISDLMFYMTFSVFPHGDGQTVRMLVGDQLVNELFFPNIGYGIFQDASFVIPHELIESGVNLELRFEFPDAVRPIDVLEESDDARLLSIAFRKISILSK